MLLGFFATASCILGSFVMCFPLSPTFFCLRLSLPVFIFQTKSSFFVFVFHTVFARKRLYEGEGRRTDVAHSAVRLSYWSFTKDKPPLFFHFFL